MAPDGELVSPGLMFGAARDGGLLFQLDLAARRSAITCAHQQRLQGALFVNFAPTAIYDPASCLRSTVAAVDQAGIARHDVVFEIVETDRARDPAHLRNILDYYRTAGFRVALDDVGAGYSSLDLIHELRPDLLKLDMELIRGVDKDPYKARLVANLLDVAAALQIDTLAKGSRPRANCTGCSRTVPSTSKASSSAARPRRHVRFRQRRPLRPDRCRGSSRHPTPFSRRLAGMRRTTCDSQRSVLFVASNSFLAKPRRRAQKCLCRAALRAARSIDY